MVLRYGTLLPNGETMRCIPIIAVLTLVAGCASAPSRPTAGDLASADHGPYPDQFQAAIKEYMARNLRDPESALYDFFRVPTKAWSGYGPTYIFGWGTCAYVNAKNGYGGYTGEQIAYFFFKDGQAIESHVSDGSPALDNLVREKCSYLPVPA